MIDGDIKVKVKQDLTGKMFNKLTVLGRGPDLISKGGQRRAAWYCLCSCGNPNKLLISGDSITSGHTKSCGCAVKDFHSGNNKYNLDGEYGRCVMKNGEAFIFDLEDYDAIKQFCWHTNPRGYIMTTLYDPEATGSDRHKNMFLHRFLMNVHGSPWQETVVDHINGDTKDNRKSNLRVVTQSENGSNSKLSVNNTSGVAGVTKHNNKWVSYIRYKTENIYLGIYENFDDAVEARKKAEEKYFGEYSYTNSRLRGDDIGIDQ